MKKLMALLISMIMVFSVVGSLADVDAANVADQPEFQVMTLGNYKYGEDYTSQIVNNKLTLTATEGMDVVVTFKTGEVTVGCGGNITASLFILSIATVSLCGLALIKIKKNKED